MQRRASSVVGVLVVAVISIGLSGIGFPAGAQQIPKFELPLIITCTGQTPGSLTFKAIVDKFKIEATHDQMLLARNMKGYKTMVVVMGASLKGLGAAGLDQEDELERSHMIFKKAKELGIKIVGTHIEGQERRNVIADRFIEPFAPLCDFLLVVADSNKDGLFTKIAEKHKIALKVVDNFVDLPPIVVQMFK